MLEIVVYIVITLILVGIWSSVTSLVNNQKETNQYLKEIRDLQAKKEK